MMDLENNSAIKKLIEYGKSKKKLSYEDINEILPADIVSSEKIDEIIMLLEKNNILIEGDKDFEEEDDEDEDDEDEDGESGKVLTGDKDGTIDDPIRLYLREIGRESLLSADQEVDLSKKMEDGENILKRVIRESGIIIPEFYKLSQKTFSKVDPKDPEMSKKELSDFMAERRRLNQFYKDSLKDVTPALKSYIELKNKILTMGGNILEDPTLRKKAKNITAHLRDIELHTEEITKFHFHSEENRKVHGRAEKAGKMPPHQGYQRAQEPGTLPCHCLKETRDRGKPGNAV